MKKDACQNRHLTVTIIYYINGSLGLDNTDGIV